MSMLFGPLSETTSKVSRRDCACAEDQTAGAETPPPTSAVAAVDFRNVRRSILKLLLAPYDAPCYMHA
jgi:hypothetical protein